MKHGNRLFDAVWAGDLERLESFQLDGEGGRRPSGLALRSGFSAMERCKASEAIKNILCLFDGPLSAAAVCPCQVVAGVSAKVGWDA